MFRISTLFALAILTSLLFFGCSSKGLLHDVGPASVTVTPSGVVPDSIVSAAKASSDPSASYRGVAFTPDGVLADSYASIGYTISKRAHINVTLKAPDGKDYVIRDEMRAPDTYEIKFNGAVDVGDSGEMRVLPNGKYSLLIEATDEQGHSEQQQVEVNVSNADTVPLEIGNVVVQPLTFSPNQSADNDTSYFSYNISKKAWTQIYVTDSDGRFHLLDPQKVRESGEQAFAWDGKENEGRLLPDGIYTYHIKAWDFAGNVTEATGQIAMNGGGTPKLEIESAKFSPTSIPLGGTVHVKIKVKNNGNSVIKSDPAGGVGPAPGTAYRTDENFAKWRDDQGNPLYYERPGTWRIGVSWTNAPTPPPFPVRWSIGKDLQPGEEAEITGDIVVVQKTREMYFWATVVQEGVGYVGDQKGQTLVIVSY